MRPSCSAYLPLAGIFVCALVAFLWHDDEERHATPELPIELGAEHEVVALSTEIQPLEAPRQPVEQAPEQPRQTTPEATEEVESPELVALRAEISALKNRIHALEGQLSVKSGQVAQWVETLRPEERPSQETLALMAEYLHDYPVVLRTEEGLWLAERIVKKDWKLWGETVDDAIFAYLGEVRLSKELSPEDFARVKP